MARVRFVLTAVWRDWTDDITMDAAAQRVYIRGGFEVPIINFVDLFQQSVNTKPQLQDKYISASL